MNTRIAKKLVSELPLNINDLARLVLEMTEALGERAEGLSRLAMLTLLRRVMAAGVQGTGNKVCVSRGGSPQERLEYS